MRNFFVPICSLIVASLFCGACGQMVATEIDNLRFTDKGLLWDAAKVDHYLVSNGESEYAINENGIDFSELLLLPGRYTVSVCAVRDGVKGKTVSVSVDAEYPSVPVIGMSDVSSDGRTVAFVWETDDDTAEYKYNLYDGKGDTPIAPSEGKCRVETESGKRQMIRVTSSGIIKDGVYYLSQSTVYEYRPDKVHDLIDYKYVFTGSGVWMELSPEKCRMTLEVDLPDGEYKNGISFEYYALYDNEEKLSGLGMWARRIAFCQNEGKNIVWLCTERADSVDCIVYGVPEADELAVYALSEADKPIVVENGKITVWCLDFEVNEMVIFAGISYNGKNVLK